MLRSSFRTLRLVSYLFCDFMHPKKRTEKAKNRIVRDGFIKRERAMATKM